QREARLQARCRLDRAATRAYPRALDAMADDVMAVVMDICCGFRSCGSGGKSGPPLARGERQSFNRSSPRKRGPSDTASELKLRLGGARPMDVIKVGIVGLGRWAKVLSRAAAKSSSLKIVSAYSRTPEKREAFAREFGIAAVGDLAAMLADASIRGVILTV